VLQARQLSRRTVRLERREFLVEGPQAVREALAVPGRVREAFVTRAALERHADIADLLRAARTLVSLSNERAIASLTGSKTPQGVVAVCAFVDVALDDALGDEARLVAVGAHVREPGNVGALIRCADAAGADFVVLTGSSVDPYNDKVVRATSGSLFHLPLVFGTSMAVAVRALHARGFTVFATDARAADTVDGLLASGALRGRVAWVFGNEAWGIPGEDRAHCDREVAVPIYGRAESLNVATAAAVCLYATAWAQRTDGPSEGSVVTA